MPHHPLRFASCLAALGLLTLGACSTGTRTATTTETSAAPGTSGTHGQPNAGPPAPTVVPASIAATPAPTISARPSQVHTLPAPARPAGASSLPLNYPTGTATQLITVTAEATGNTVATLQTWQRAGSGWTKVGPAVTAHIGSQGMSASPSESRSATPMGSFTLTQAFGRDADPGTALPYLRTTPSDWWISQSGSLYNTHQRCSSGCRFNQGSPNEHLYYETPFYNYAVVIDYNTRNAGVVRQGAGSAFFLHVTDGAATAGCVAVPQAQVVRILRWLQPADHPRILIGVN